MDERRIIFLEGKNCIGDKHKTLFSNIMNVSQSWLVASSFELDLPNMLTQCIHKYRKIAKRIFAYE